MGESMSEPVIGRIEFGQGQAGADAKPFRHADIETIKQSLMNGMCRKCGERKAVLDWVNEGGALAFVHGLSMRWCELCAVTAQLEHARKMAANIPTLEAKLAELIGSK